MLGEDVVQPALEAQVKQLFLFHHDPEATDEHLNERQFLAQQRFRPFVAREGLKSRCTASAADNRPTAPAVGTQRKGQAERQVYLKSL